MRLPSPTPIPSACALFATLGLVCAAPPAAADDWWRDAVFYEVFVRSFADSTEGPLAGDGVGDLRGLIERLDYLNDGDPDTRDDLGVTALWLMPICQSPSYHGYDVADYRRVDDEYGTNEDFLALIDAAHARGMRVIVDLVINHTSDSHPWFREARTSRAPKRDWYVWSDEPIPVNWGSRVWHDPSRSGERPNYFGLFWSGMPDLNLRNAETTAAVHEFSKFWLTDMRADGFRLDAAKHLIENWPEVENTDETLAWLETYRSAMKEASHDAFLVGEVWSSADQIARYVPAALDAAFEFDLASAIVEGVRDADPARIARAIETAQRVYPPGQYATFLANHDMQRVMTTLLEGSASPEEALAKAKLCATIQLTLPGIPFIYYGEEIGMTGAKPDPDLRRPMQWTPDPETAGFTTGIPWREPQVESREQTVVFQDIDEGSLLNHYRRLLHTRSTHPALTSPRIRILTTQDPRLLVYVRRADDKPAAVIIANCSADEIEEITLDEHETDALRSVLPGRLPPWGSAIVIPGPADDR